MASDLINFPLATIVDGILSYLQHQFGNPEIVPPAYRWVSDDRQSRIRISGLYSPDNEKPGSVPAIIVERATFIMANMAINNLESADANTFDNPKHVDIMDGAVIIRCISMVPSEASSLANFIAIMMQSDRHRICSTLQLNTLTYLDVGPEQPIEMSVEPRRVQVILRFKASIYLGWIKYERGVPPFNKVSIKSVDKDMWVSTDGELQQGVSNIIDQMADFGLLLTNDPQLLQKELEQKWYYICLDGSERLYTVEEIVNNHTLRLSDKDASDAVIPFNPAESKLHVGYKLQWNAVHINVELPKH